jgi:hypothetical protein
MRNRSLFTLLLFLLAVFLIVKFDVATKVKVAVISMIYGNEMRGMKGFRVVVVSPSPELAKEGLSQETIRQGLISTLEKAGVKSLMEWERQKIPGKPVLTVTVNTMKTGSGLYQYTVTMEVEKSEELQTPAAVFPEKAKTIWSTSGMGEGDVSDVRAEINEATNLFLKAHSGVGTLAPLLQ